MYGITTKDGWKTSAEISAALNPEIEYQLAHRVAIRELERKFCSYSNQDLDVLSAALSAQTATETPTIEQPWVEYNLSQMDSQDWLAVECEIAAMAITAERGDHG